MRRLQARAKSRPAGIFACCRCHAAAGCRAATSFVGAILAEAGLANAAGDLGVDFGGFASLEAIVSVKPDFLVVSDAGDRAEDDGRAFLLHPALERFYPRAKRIVIPERMTECGGVLLADALNALTAELKRVGR
jgi:iron complex transport system substrate-binding protein